MNVSSVANTNAAIAAQTATSRGFGDLKSEDFLALMIQELQSQDPLNPQDTGQLLQQLSNIRQIEQSSNSNKTLETLSQTLQALSAGQRFGDPTNLIGKYVAGTTTDPSGQPTEVQGVVIGTRFDPQGNAILELHNGTFIPADQVEQITLVENLPPDVLQQLQDELNGTAAGGSSPLAKQRIAENANSSGYLQDANEAGKNLYVPPQRGSSNRRVEMIAELIDSLLSPGVGVGVGL